MAKIKSINKKQNEDVYDISVENNHNFFANGILVHNCGEQPLPPYGSCLLGSFNLVKYLDENKNFNYKQFKNDIHDSVRAMDNVIDETTYPLPQQEEEAKNKRRMGLGVTGLANAIEIMGLSYGDPYFLGEMENILETLRNETYRASIQLAKEKGEFPLFDKEKYLKGNFIQTLPEDIQNDIAKYGIRNSHLTSIAPTGTISLTADNISSGIEPVFTHYYTRTIQTFDGPMHEDVTDYAYREHNIEGIRALDIDVEDHVNVLNTAQQYIDSACSKTCNVGDDVSWERFKDVYMQAYEGGAKGCTTFRAAGKRFGILNEKNKEENNDETYEGEYIDDEDSVEACTFDTQTGQPTCS